jgi:hypothetical protein
MLVDPVWKSKKIIKKTKQTKKKKIASQQVDAKTIFQTCHSSPGFNILEQVWR